MTINIKLGAKITECFDNLEIVSARFDIRHSRLNFFNSLMKV